MHGQPHASCPAAALRTGIPANRHALPGAGIPARLRATACTGHKSNRTSGDARNDRQAAITAETSRALDGCTRLVTGGGSGIGLAVAVALTASGAG